MQLNDWVSFRRAALKKALLAEAIKIQNMDFKKFANKREFVDICHI